MGEKRRKTRYRRIRADSGQQRRIGLVMAVLGAAAFLPVAVRLYGLMVSSYDTWSALALGNKTIMMNNGSIVMELEGEERATMTTEELLRRFHQQGMSNDRILFSAE